MNYDQHLEEPRQLERHDCDLDGESESELERRANRSDYTRGAVDTEREIIAYLEKYSARCRTTINLEMAGIIDAAIRSIRSANFSHTDPTGGEHQAPESFTGEIVQAGYDEDGQPRAIIYTNESQLSAIKQNLIGAKVRVTLIQP